MYTVCIWVCVEIKEFKNCLLVIFYFELYEMDKNSLRKILPDYPQWVCKMQLAATISFVEKDQNLLLRGGLQFM